MSKLTPAKVYKEITAGLKKFTKENNIKKCVIGISGGIDCAVVSALAVDVFGPSNVYGVAIPTKFSSKESLTLAKKLAKNLKINFQIINIDGTFEAIVKEMGGIKKLKPLTVQNIQPRLRSNVLMAVSSEVGGVVLATGNKTEVATGYYTLYGDSCGAIAPLACLYKEMVYKLAAYINRNKELIPQGTITRPPTAELAHNQKDEDDLLPYSVLDKILHMYLDLKLEPSTIAKKLNITVAEVEKIENRYRKNMFKKAQAAPPLLLSKCCHVDL
ncbi:NAD+ synthetase [Elusimicrobium minutum Pei191]|uniref:NH(3)-dependent NAD(+) synthetase n=1 Tax=Elusimicrobium minutum (strain Pei191) TaxID=445932 RepID=B2KC80_ELUMP|nr:NAD(+) synthase [Elusimicrobium minutum]ACC98207.1 NAD+ synthetase [Elusimicrobium minutum Pei191]